MVEDENEGGNKDDESTKNSAIIVKLKKNKLNLFPQTPLGAHISGGFLFSF